MSESPYLLPVATSHFQNFNYAGYVEGNTYQFDQGEANYGLIDPSTFNEFNPLSYEVYPAYWCEDNYNYTNQESLQNQYALPIIPTQMQGHQYLSSPQFNYQASWSYNNYNPRPPLVVHHSQQASQTRIPAPTHYPVIPIISRSDPFSEDIDLGIYKPFISKLCYLLNNTQLFGDIIKWSDDGTKFIVAHSTRFTEVLSQVYSHSSDSAFTRQLNTYGFRRLRIAELAVTFLTSPDSSVSFKDLSGWEHASMNRSYPSLANTMVPIQSKARAAHALRKQALLNQGASIPRKPRMTKPRLA